MKFLLNILEANESWLVFRVDLTYYIRQNKVEFGDIAVDWLDKEWKISK